HGTAAACIVGPFSNHIPTLPGNRPMSIQEDSQGPAGPQPGMSTMAKVLIVLAALGGVALLLCCGGGIYFGNKVQEFVKNAASDDPETIRSQTSRIVRIEIPPGFAPKKSVDAVFMRMAMYSKEGETDSLLMLMEYPTKMMEGAGGPQPREQ